MGDLYHHDLSKWAREQSSLLRGTNGAQFDQKNIADEIESLAVQQEFEIASLVDRHRASDETASLAGA